MLEEGFDDDYIAWRDAEYALETAQMNKKESEILVSLTNPLFVGDLYINADKMSNIVIHKDDKKYTLEFDELKRLTIKMEDL